MDQDQLGPREVSRVLECLRQGKTLQDSPLLSLVCLRRHLAETGTLGTSAALEATLDCLLGEIVWGALSALRQCDQDLHAVPRADAQLLGADLVTDDVERQAWSCLYHRYFSHPTLQVQQIAAVAQPASRDASRWVHRRMQRGLELLSERLRVVERRAKAASPQPDELNAERRWGKLPRPVTSFIGRGTQLRRLIATLRRERLVVLTGPPGVGKTRLAVEAAQGTPTDFADGAWFLELPKVDEHAIIESAIAGLLGVQSDASESGQTLAEQLAGRSLLLVLDNAEHVVDACSEVCRSLLSQCPRLHIAVTSQAVLHVDGAFAWTVRPLTLPACMPSMTTRSALESEAVRLFVDRAVRIRPGFKLTSRNVEAVVHICRELDGVPLEIELAAAWVNVLGVQDIADRLTNRLELLTRVNVGGHGRPTLRQTLDLSFQLLRPSEQRLFARLSVFDGSFDLRAVEEATADNALDGDAIGGVITPPAPRAQVASGPTIDSESALMLLASLVDRSLVSVVESQFGERYALLRSLQDYAGDQLVRFGEQAILRARHAAYYLRFAEDASARLSGPDQEQWFQHFAIEKDNLQAALDWSLAERQPEVGLPLATAVAHVWQLRNALSEARRYLESLLAMSEGVAPHVRARALNAAGALAREMGDYEAAGQFAAAEIALRRDLDDEPGLAACLRTMGSIADELGDYDSAERLYEESLAHYRACNDRWGIAAVHNNLGLSAYHRGDFGAAEPQLEESLAMFEAIGERWAVGVTQLNLGKLAFDIGNRERAARLFEQSLEIARALGDTQGEGAALWSLAYLAYSEKKYTLARERYRDCLATLGEVEDRQFAAEWLEAMAVLDRAEGNAKRAVQLFGAAERLRGSIGAPVIAKDQVEHDAHLAALRQALSEEQFRVAWESGQSLDWRVALTAATGMAT